jgi:hypothetical protein
MSDEITLTLPSEREFHRVAHLVLGGLAIRHELTIETLEDLQLALGAILDRAAPADELTVTLSLEAGVLHARVGPVDVTGELEREAENELNLRRVLAAVVDDVDVDGEWVELEKRFRSA